MSSESSACQFAPARPRPSGRTAHPVDGVGLALIVGRAIRRLAPVSGTSTASLMRSILLHCPLGNPRQTWRGALDSSGLMSTVDQTRAVSTVLYGLKNRSGQPCALLSETPGEVGAVGAASSGHSIGMASTSLRGHTWVLVPDDRPALNEVRQWTRKRLVGVVPRQSAVFDHSAPQQ